MVGASQLMTGEIELGTETLLQALEVARDHDLELRRQSGPDDAGDSGLGEMFELDQAERVPP